MSVLPRVSGGGEGCSRARPAPQVVQRSSLLGPPAPGISYTTPHPSRHLAVFPSFEGGLWKVPWASLGWAAPAPAGQPQPASRGPWLAPTPGSRRRNSCGQAGWAAPPLPQAPPLPRSLPHSCGTSGLTGCGPRVELGPVSRVGEGPSASSLCPEVGLGGQVRSAPVEGTLLSTALPPLTVLPGLMILLPFLSPGHRDPLASGHVAPRRHSPEAQGTVVKLLPEERSRHWAKKRGLTGGCRPRLCPSPQVSWTCPCVPGAPGCWGWAGRRDTCPPCSAGFSLPSPS